MNYHSHHADKLECEISGKTDRTFLHISWDKIIKQYALGFRVYYGRAILIIETLYIDDETISLFYQRLPEVLSI
jgi:hypothetical protein